LLVAVGLVPEVLLVVAVGLVVIEQQQAIRPELLLVMF
jgi:hypothetical protein